MLIKKNVKILIKTTPDAKPSKPSIQFIEFVIPTIQTTVMNKLSKSGTS